MSTPATRFSPLWAALWLVLMLGVAVHQWRFWQSPDFASDVVDLLPQQDDPALAQATRRLIESTSRQWVVLVGARDWEAAKAAADAALPLLDPQRQRLQGGGEGGGIEPWLAQFAPSQGALLTRESRRWLQQATEEDLGRRALQNLMQPVGAGLSDWRSDPLGLWSDWLRERAQASSLRPREGWLWVEEGGLQWVALPFAEGASGFAAWSGGENTERLAAVRQRLAGLPGEPRLLAAGTVLQAEAAAKRATFEVSVIGTGSLVAVILLTWLTFGSLRPILLVTLSLTLGCAAALAVTDLLFGRVHVLTMVFGASLIGVAEDYGIHYFAARQGQPVDRRWRQLREILPGLWLALATSGIAYLALGLAPFPGLRQIAVFSCVGLAAAFLTVLCWFPWLDVKPLRTTRFATRFAGTLARWPRFPRGTRGLLLALLAVAAFATGWWRLHAVDDVRLLQNVPPALLDEQIQVGRILGLASPAQAYLVSGDSEERLLRNEEALTARLEPLVRAGTIRGYRAVSDSVPSAATQSQDARLIAAGDRAAWRRIAAATGEDIDLAPPSAQPLRMATLASGPLATLAALAWRADDATHHSIVMLEGVTRAALAPLADAARGLAGVRFVDSTARFSRVLSDYRQRLSLLLAAGALAVVVTLHLRYRAQAWRAYVPTLVGGALTLAAFGWLGIPLQLFVVLSLILLLGMGIDYGIFMLEHPGAESVWLAVAIAGISTLLSFGLLALSSTPALHAFGLCMLIGETAIWLTTPLFRTESAHA